MTSKGFRVMSGSNFHHLPNELVTEIFLHCLPSKGYLRPDTRAAPLLLSHVCSSWRACTMTIPQLWTSLHIELKAAELLTTGNDCRGMPQMSNLNEQVMHWGRLSSPNQPFDLHLFIENAIDANGMSDPAEGFWRPFIELVVQTHASHLRNLILDVEDYESCTPFWKLHGTELPMLEALHFHFWDEPDDLRKAQFDAIQVTASAPRLRKAWFDYNTPTDKLIPLPWAQLTYLLVASGITDRLFLFLLTACPQLETLSVLLDGWEENPLHALPARICGKSLQNLDITLLANHTTSRPTFFWSVEFPALLNLTLRDDINANQVRWEPRSQARDHLFHQLQRLQTLKLSYQNMPTSLLLDLLCSTPTLKELAVDCQWIPDDGPDSFNYPSLLDALTYRPNQEAILPLLVVFGLYVEISTYRPLEPAYPFTASNFISMVKSRCKSSMVIPSAITGIIVPLRRVSLYTQRVPSSALDVGEVSRGLAALCESEGIEATVHTSNSTDNWLPRQLKTWDS